MKLYPPYIEGKLPAFTRQDDGNLESYSVTIKVPFQLNPAVGESDYDSMSIIVKNISSNTTIINGAIIKKEDIHYDMINHNYYVEYSFSENKKEKDEAFKSVKTNYYNQKAYYSVQIYNLEESFQKKEITKDEYERQKANLLTEIEKEEETYRNEKDEYDKWVAAYPHFLKGQYYRIQLAFIKSDQVGYYSTTGIIKCTSTPILEISGLGLGRKNSNPVNFIGSYKQEEDKTEKVYSYQFNVYDEYHNLYATSGEKIHNSNKDTVIGESYDEWTLDSSLQVGKVYSVEYTVTTNNLLAAKSEEYLLIDSLLIDEPENMILKAELDNDNGKTDIKLYSSVITENNELIYAKLSGNYKIVRASSEDNYTEWVDLFDLVIADKAIEQNTPLTWSDFTLKHGVSYKYAIQRYNKYGVRSNRLEVDGIVKAEFVDMFLFDGEKQLRIAFNPNVSSFKTTLLESKSDTLGGQYPVFYRNGNTAYKEFPISGLISINMDQNLLFFDEKLVNHPQFFGDGLGNRQRPSTPSQEKKVTSIGTSLDTDTMKIERDFKLAALDWLTNGKPKLFRSPAEGNYFVRLMNTSLSPNDTLGRMIHTFNSTAYEVGKSDYKSLVSAGLIKVYNTEEILETTESKVFYSEEKEFELPIGRPIRKLELFDFLDGSVTAHLGETTVMPVAKTSMGYYRWENVSIDGLKFTKGNGAIRGVYQYSYERTMDSSNFDTYKSVCLEEETQSFESPEGLIPAKAYIIDMIHIESIEAEKELVLVVDDKPLIISTPGTYLIKNHAEKVVVWSCPEKIKGKVFYSEIKAEVVSNEIQ